MLFDFLFDLFQETRVLKIWAEVLKICKFFFNKFGKILLTKRRSDSVKMPLGQQGKECLLALYKEDAIKDR